MRGMPKTLALIAKALRLMGMAKAHKKFVDYWWTSLQQKAKDNA